MEARVRARLEADIERPPPRRARWAAAVLALVIASGLFGLRFFEQSGHRMRLADGSSIETLAQGALFEVRRVTDRDVLVELQSGAVRIRVPPRPSRVFRVQAGKVEVKVLGTRFLVERSGARIHVKVEEGVVSATGGELSVTLNAGEQTVFEDIEAQVQRPSPAPEAVPEESTLEPAAGPPASSSTRLPPGLKGGSRSPEAFGPPRKSTSKSWRRRADVGDFEGAAAALGDEGRLHSVADLMLASDVLRLTGQSERAVRLLRRVASEFPQDPRAPLACFTIGRILLDDLGRPREAAQAFEKIRRSYSAFGLAEDALAREVEAWSLAGEVSRSHDLAELYLKRYPDGYRRNRVERYGEIE